MNRRQFIGKTVCLSAALKCIPTVFAQKTTRLMKISLNCGNIGVNTDLISAINLAKKHGFEAIDWGANAIAALKKEEQERVVGLMKDNNLVWGATGLTVDFRGDESRFKDGLRKLPDIASALKTVGLTRMTTWISPTHPMLGFDENFKLHKERFTQIARVLKDFDIMFGIEYVGTKTSRQRGGNLFIYNMKQALELIEAIGADNIGLVLDSWHWWQADETVEDLLKLKSKNIVAVDLNDAPAGIPKENQKDNRRELPAATGVIDLKGFLSTLAKINYDGPLRAEPFNQQLNDMDNDNACAATIAAMKKAFAMAGIL
ncbi:MAG: sugar phosphate isomerase/epimerase family protein [Verrucomicrobiia bacterium]